MRSQVRRSDQISFGTNPASSAATTSALTARNAALFKLRPGECCAASVRRAARYRCPAPCSPRPKMRFFAVQVDESGIGILHFIHHIPHQQKSTFSRRCLRSCIELLTEFREPFSLVLFSSLFNKPARPSSARGGRRCNWLFFSSAWRYARPSQCLCPSCGVWVLR
jgi:hypothetical protein